MNDMNYNNELTTLLAELVSIDSVNPDILAGAKGEADVAAFIADWATRAGLQVIVQDAAPGRPNVIVIARGSGGGKNLMLNAHTDTVGVAGMDEPFRARIEGNQMYGRGSYDMKAGLAASLIAAKRAMSLSLRGDVIVTCVVDEEMLSIGTEAICRELERWRPDAVIVTEFTEMELMVAHRGFAWFEIETFGIAAHGSRPHLGIDAIAKMGKVLVELEKHDLALRANPTHPFLGSGSIHCSLIQGGQEMSTFPAHCKLQVERRTIPGETPDVLEQQLQALLDACAQADEKFRAKLTRGFERAPFEIQPDAPLVQLCSRHLAKVTNTPAKMNGVSFWADSALFSKAGVPTVLLGPRGEGAHGAVEWVDLDSVQQCADVYTAVAQEFCA